MIRAATTLGSAALGLAFALLSMTAANRFHLLPNFPAFAGEDDFTLRAEVFFFVVCPAFVVLGAALELLRKKGGRSVVYTWLGVASGTLVSFVIVGACGDAIEHLSSRSLANFAAITFLLGWPTLAAVGGILTRRI